MKEQFIEYNFRKDSLDRIAVVNKVIEDFQDQGFTLTLRQLYYQLVKENIIANKEQEYDKLGVLLNNARLAGLVDWSAIEDRTRFVRSNAHYSSPGSAIRSAAYWYGIDKWQNQEYRPEVWIEKDALVGVIEGPCEALDVSYFSCRGYTSQSEMKSAGDRLLGYIEQGQHPVIIHLGDHDPSGLDMTSDITNRLNMFTDFGMTVERIALNMDQIAEYNPPPNPAKLTDSRCRDYIKRFGKQSWELDSMPPAEIARRIDETIRKYRDPDRWDEMVSREEAEKGLLLKTSSNWPKVEQYVKGLD